MRTKTLKITIPFFPEFHEDEFLKIFRKLIKNMNTISIQNFTNIDKTHDFEIKINYRGKSIDFSKVSGVTKKVNYV